MTSREAPFAAIFDWDGVIIDSAKLHELSWSKLAAEIGSTVAPGAFLRGFGMTSEHIIREIHRWSDDADRIRTLSRRKEALYRELVEQSGIEALPGVKPWLATLESAGIKSAIASSTHRLNIETVLKVIGLTNAFDIIVSAEDVSSGKPDPEVFLKAAERLQMEPSRCVVFEDAHVGVEAAHAAGMAVVAVPTTNARKELRRADVVVDRLDDLTVDRLAALVAGRAAAR
jgi:beta-phosphoglucomutase family hydrolase